METGIQALISAVQDNHLKQIGEKIINKERISFDEGVALFEKGSLSYVGALANWVREQKHGNNLFQSQCSYRTYQCLCVFLQVLFLFPLIRPS